MATLTAKEKGDQAFKARDYPAAIGHWSAAIVADRSDPLIPLNRAAAYLKLDKFEDAERDCTTTLSLTPGNVKAWFRRAHARKGQLMLQEAIRDFQRAYQLDPALAAAKTNIDELVKQLPDGAETKLPPLEFDLPPLAGASNTPQPPPLGTALDAPTPAPATPLRRIPITIVEPSNAPPSPPDSAPEPTSPAPDPLDFLDPLAHLVNLDDFPENPDDAPPAPYWSYHWSPYHWQNSARGTYARAGTVASTSQPEPAPQPENEDQDAVVAAMEAARRAAKDALWGVTPPAPPPPPLPAPAEVPPVPAPTLISFTRAWNAAHTPEQRWAVLAALPPPSLPALFQNSLDPGFLSALLSTFTALLDAHPADDELKAWIRAYMVALEGVPRAGFVAMLAGREAGRTVWARVAPAGEGGGALWAQ